MPGAFDGIYPIGLGAARFPFVKPDEYAADFENAVELVLYALEKGVNYIDVGPGYSTNKALSVLKEAFSRTDKAFNVSLKVHVFDVEAQSAAAYYTIAMDTLHQMGLEQASHFLLWTLMDSPQFKSAIEKDSLYETALRLQSEGKIKHIGASVHMTHDEIIEVIDSGLFEFVLMSYHLLNFLDMQRVLDHALEKEVDILVMNPLYGGLIPQNEKLFEYAKMDGDKTVVQAAIRAVLAHPAVKCVLAGPSSKEQLDEYLSSVMAPGFTAQNRAGRIVALKENISGGKTFCSYCRYCVDCPVGIPVPEIMNARNIYTLQDGGADGLDDKIFFRLLNEKFQLTFETWQNPCVQCGRCEEKCTQHLDIIKTIDEVYGTVRQSGYDMASRKERFDDLLGGKGYKKVGFWPASAGTMKIIDIYRDLFGDVPFDVLLFDSNAELHGKEMFKHTVHAKEEAKPLGVNCILITSFNYGATIRDQIKDLEEQGIDVKVLYKTNDVDWWW